MQKTQNNQHKKPTHAQLNKKLRSEFFAQSVLHIQNLTRYSVPIINGDLSDQTRVVKVLNSGVIKGFHVTVDYEIKTLADALTKTEHGVTGLLTNVQFRDYDNITRINASGLDLYLVNTASRNKPYGASYTLDNSMVKHPFPDMIIAPNTIAANTASAKLRARFYVPLMPNKNSLAGGLVCNRGNKELQLEIKIPKLSELIRTADGFGVAYTQANLTATINSATVSVEQEFYGEHPHKLPTDVNVCYCIMSQQTAGIVANGRTDIAYDKAWTYHETFMSIYTNAFYQGDDLTTIEVLNANNNSEVAYDPKLLTLRAQDKIGAIMPKGTYHISHKDRPINGEHYENKKLSITTAPTATITATSAVRCTYVFSQLAKTLIQHAAE